MCFLVLESGVGFGASLKCALVRLFACVSSHVHDQHVLSFEWFSFTRTVSPAADETLLVVFDVILFQMFDKFFLCPEFPAAVLPFAVRLNQISGLIVVFVVVVVIMGGFCRCMLCPGSDLIALVVADSGTDDIAGSFPLVSGHIRLSFGET